MDLRRATTGGRNGLGFRALPIGPKVVPFWGSYLEFPKTLNPKVIPKRELLWGLWVNPKV